MWLCCRLSTLHSDWRPRFRGASFANPACRADGWRCVWVPGCPGCHEVPSCPSHCAGWVRIKHTQTPKTPLHWHQPTSNHWGAKWLMEKASLVSLASHSLFSFSVFNFSYFQSASVELRGTVTKSDQYHNWFLFLSYICLCYLIFH